MTTSGRRLFRTVLFTDIVGSTEIAAELGDRKWRRTVAAHHAAIRAELKRHRGREVDTAGDGFFAVFESPTDAVRCAAGAVAAVHALGLRIRAAVHTGEVEQAGSKYGGIAVHIGARVLALAGPEEILVSSTVRELVAGSGHAFDDRAVHELKGVPGEWHVYSLAMPRFEEGVPLVSTDDEQLRAVAARRQRMIVGGLLGLIAVLAVGLVLAFLVLNQPQLPARGPNTIALYDTAGTEPVRGLTVDRGPADVAIGDGAYWTANIDAGTVSRVDAATGRATSLGQAGARPTSLAVAGGRVWVADRYSGRLTSLDQSTGTVLGTFPLHVSAMIATDGQLWLADDIGERIIRLDPTSGGQLAEIPFDAATGASDLASAGGSIWIAAPRSGGVVRVDVAASTTTEVPLGLADVQAMSAAGDDLWVVSPSEDGAARIDATSGRVAVTVDVCDTPVDVAATASGAWIVCARGDQRLWRVDRSGSVVTRLELDGVPASAVAEGERVWVALRAD